MKKDLSISSSRKPKNSCSLFRALVLLFVFTALLVTGASAAATGDYQSATTGNWTALTSWQRWSGTAWVTPTSGQGYPGQITGTGAVTIQAGHTITLSSAITTAAMGQVTINSTGQLYLSGSSTQVVFTLNTMTLNIISGGSVYFLNKARLTLSLNAIISVTTGGLTGTCNANDEIYLGTILFAACTGAPGSIFTFAQLMSNGGTLNAVPTSVPASPVCQGTSFTFTGNSSGAVGTAPTYSWSVTPPGGSPTIYNTKDVPITNAATGTYSATLTVSTVLNGTTYTNSETISVVVNALPTLSGASQLKTVCDGSPATINLTGLIANTMFTVNYKINTVAQTAITGLTTGAGTTSGFTTPNLSASNNGQILQITGITITNPTTNCAQIFTQDVTLSVWTTGAGTWTGTTSTDWNTASNWCGNIVPTSTTDVTIPNTSSIPNQPVIGAVKAMCQNITINPTASLTISGSDSLIVFGNWTNNGTFTPNSGEVKFRSTAAAQTIGGSGTNSFYNLTIKNRYTGGGVKAGGNITVNGVLNLAAANPSSTAGCLDMVSSWGNYPTDFTGFSSYTLYMGSTATTICPSGTPGLTGDVTGIIQRNTIAALTPYTFGNQYTTVSFTSGGTLPTALKIYVKIGTAPYTGSVLRHWELVPTGGSGCYVATNFHYLDTEMNGNTEVNLVTGDFDIGPGGSSTPDEHGRSAYDFTNNYIGFSNVPISYFIQTWRTIFLLRDYQIGYKTWYGKTSTNWFDETNWSPTGDGGGGYPGIGNFVIIPSGAPSYPILTNLQTPSINTLTVQTGASLDLGTFANTFTINNSLSGGWEDQNGGVVPGNSKVIFANPGATVSGLCNFNDIEITTGADLTVQAGTNMKIAGSLTRSGVTPGKWYADVYNNTIEYNKAGTQTIVLPDDSKYSNLILSGSGTKDLPALTRIDGNLTLSGTVSTGTATAQTIVGNFTLGSGTIFTAGAYIHYLAGNFTNNGGTFTNTGSTINLNGNAAQTIGGSNSTTFNNLTLNNSAGATLGISENVAGTLTLTNGLLTTTDSYTIRLTACSGTTITGYGAGSYVNGKLAQDYCAIGSKVFPIGKGGNYRPLTFNYSAGTTPNTITAEQIESPLPGIPPASTSLFSIRYWAITESVSSTQTYYVTLNGTDFSPSHTVKMIMSDGSTNTAYTITAPNYTNATGFTGNITTTTNFGLGEAIIATTTTPDNTAVCYGSTSVNLTATVAPNPGGGMVQFYIDGSTVGSPVSLSSGVATYTYNPSALSASGHIIRADFSGSGDYWASSSNSGNNKTLTVNALPAATAGSNSPVCEGATLSLTGGPAAMTSYSWTGPASYSYSNSTQNPTVSSTATLAMGGTYILTVTDGNGCVGSANTYITINP